MNFAYNKVFIDFHTHLFPEKLYEAIKDWFSKNVHWNFHFNGTSAEAFDFLNCIKNLEKFVVFGYAHKPDISEKLNSFYVELMKKSSKTVPLGTIHQDDSCMSKLVNKALDDGLVGFKIHCQVQKVSPNDTRFEPVYDILSERKGFILFHAGTAPFPSEYTGFAEFYKFIKRFPHIKVVVAHLGAFETEYFLKLATDYENVYLDTSYAFIANPTNKIDADLKLIERAADKIFFGSDFPGICHSYEDGLNAIASLNLSDVTLDKIFYYNAKQFLEKYCF